VRELDRAVAPARPGASHQRERDLHCFLSLLDDKTEPGNHRNVAKDLVFLPGSPTSSTSPRPLPYLPEPNKTTKPHGVQPSSYSPYSLVRFFSVTYELIAPKPGHGGT
jgi:hypothetical protein